MKQRSASKRSRAPTRCCRSPRSAPGAPRQARRRPGRPPRAPHLRFRRYDSHREAILRDDGGSGGEPGGPPEDEFSLFPFFRPSAFSGYGDGPAGFYAVYERVFRRLWDQEKAPLFAAGKLHSPSPPFGLSSASRSAVAAFYDFWLSFSTVKEYCWADQHNTSLAPGRKARARARCRPRRLPAR